MLTTKTIKIKIHGIFTHKANNINHACIYSKSSLELEFAKKKKKETLL